MHKYLDRPLIEMTQICKHSFGTYINAHKICSKSIYWELFKPQKVLKYLLE